MSWFIYLIYISFFSFAQSDMGRGSTATYADIRSGTLTFPAAFCPGINKRYEDLSEKLGALRTTITSQANCSAEKTKFEGFAMLAEKGRTDFWDLVKKGRQTKLSDEENSKLSAYIEGITKAGAAIIDMVLGSPCFNDGESGMITVEAVATLVIEATSAIGTLKGGAIGSYISWGGQITASLMVSIDKIARHRKAYDFSNHAQRRIFIKTVCSYEGFRHEIDEITRLDSVIEDWRNYQAALGRQISGITKACDECREIAKQYNADVKDGADYVRRSMGEIKEKFSSQVATADAKFYLPIGTQITKDIRMFLMSEDYLTRLNHLVSDLGDIERDRIIQQQAAIEDFLYVKWMPPLIVYYQSEVEARLKALTKNLYRVDGLVESAPWFWRTTEEMITKIFSPNADVLGPVSRRQKDAFLASARHEVTRQLSEIASAILIVEKHCEFVRAAKLKYDQAMFRTCAPEKMARAYQLIWNVLQTTHKEAPTLKAVFEVPSYAQLEWAEKNKIKLPRTDYVWTSNWIQSLVLMMEQLSTHEATTYERKPDTP